MRRETYNVKSEGGAGLWGERERSGTGRTGATEGGGLVYLVYLVCLVGRTGKPTRRTEGTGQTRQTRETR